MALVYYIGFDDPFSAPKIYVSLFESCMTISMSWFNSQGGMLPP